MSDLKTEFLKAEKAFDEACARCESLPYGSPAWMVAIDEMSKALDRANRAEDALDEALARARNLARLN